MPPREGLQLTPGRETPGLAALALLVASGPRPLPIIAYERAIFHPARQKGQLGRVWGKQRCREWDSPRSFCFFLALCKLRAVVSKIGF
jgi:hypothetical protein